MEEARRVPWEQPGDSGFGLWPQSPPALETLCFKSQKGKGAEPWIPERTGCPAEKHALETLLPALIARPLVNGSQSAALEDKAKSCLREWGTCPSTHSYQWQHRDLNLGLQHPAHSFSSIRTSGSPVKELPCSQGADILVDLWLKMQPQPNHRQRQKPTQTPLQTRSVESMIKDPTSTRHPGQPSALGAR